MCKNNENGSKRKSAKLRTRYYFTISNRILAIKIDQKFGKIQEQKIGNKQKIKLREILQNIEDKFFPF